MHREVDPKPSLEKPLSYLLVFLSGDHLHNWQGKAQRARLRFSLGKRPDGNSSSVRKWVGHCFEFLTINAYPLGLRIAHSLELSADFVKFNRMLAGGQSINVHDSYIVSDKHSPRFPQGPNFYNVLITQLFTGP